MYYEIQDSFGKTQVAKNLNQLAFTIIYWWDSLKGDRYVREAVVERRVFLSNILLKKKETPKLEEILFLDNKTAPIIETVSGKDHKLVIRETDSLWKRIHK